jgi:hypothetical protein
VLILVSSALAALICGRAFYARRERAVYSARTEFAAPNSRRVQAMPGTELEAIGRAGTSAVGQIDPSPIAVDRRRQDKVGDHDRCYAQQVRTGMKII